ncbi:MAG: NUDIX domain-containing protein [Planctomycetes bacterium]|nr:NUDIX domain-containing protein [Planctomycetota bacterium]
MPTDFTGVVGILEEDGAILHVLNERVLGGEARPCWDLPGGGVELGESLTDALVREFSEEAGLDVVPRELAFVIERFGMRTGLREERTRFFIFTVDRAQGAVGRKPQAQDAEILQCEFLDRGTMNERCIEVYQRPILDWLDGGRQQRYFLLQHSQPFADPKRVF